MLSLANNPLQMLHKNSLSSLSISYISIRSSKLESLYGNCFNKNVRNYYLDITDILLDYLDSWGTEILSYYFYLKFDDSRLCCISFHIIIAPSVYRVHHFADWYRNHGNEFICISCKLYANKGFIFYQNGIFPSFGWRRYGILPSHNRSSRSLLQIYLRTGSGAMAAVGVCQLMESVSTITSILSPVLSGLLVFLISQGITKVKFNIADYSNIIAFSLVGMTTTTICLSLSLTWVINFKIHIWMIKGIRAI